MKFSVNWLRELVELPPSVEKLAEILTFAGVEIEGIEPHGLDLAHVVVARINASAQHPNADRLSVCDVDDGTNPHRQIVCGAKNYKAGDKVPVALPGAELPNGLKIKVSKLRGVESQGMLCSPSELKLSEDSDGLLILSPEAEVGAPISTIFPPDTILDVEITPNRSDLLSYVGLAREIAALTKEKARLPEVPEPTTTHDGTVQISARNECPFYSARLIRNITVGSSPDWLRAKLEAAGLRSINNIVDATNLVMLEMGQPLHAFDADKLQGGINVRLAHEGEKFLALDGKTYSLGPEDIVIADAARAVGLGGVMGGEETGVTTSTTNVLLESAYFLPSSVRRTARRLNLPSDASYRFERGVDPAMVLRASERTTQLIRELAGGVPANEGAVDGDPPPPPADVTLRYARCDALLGITLPPAEIDQPLERCGLTRVASQNDSATWRIPSYRPDLQREVDLIEEVVRHYGIWKIPSRNRSLSAPASAADRSADADARLRQRLVARGFSEARTSALIPRQSSHFAHGAVELKNPLSEDHVALRPSLLPGLLQVLERNIRAGADSIRLFELGRIFLSPDAQEERHLALLCSGNAQGAPDWRAGARRRLDFFDLKGALDSLGARDLVFRRTEKESLAFAAEILREEKVIGFAGQLAASVASALGGSAPVFVLEMQLAPAIATETARFAELDRFPSIQRDIAMIVPERVTHAEVATVIEGAKEPLLARAEIFDLFSGKDAAVLGAGRKSMAYSLTYRDKNRTLTNDEITVVHTRIRERLKSELGAELRE